MKIKKIKKFKELPPEAGVTYQTKIAAAWKFTITAIDPKVKNVVYGIYSGTAEDTGTVCPISVDRLVLLHSDEVIEEYWACPHCDKKIDV